MKNSFFYSYLRTSKKFIWLILATTAILSVIFIRTVPNYSKKYGFEIVHLWDYNKYHQGYCLAENRILSKEELYNRVILDYFSKFKEYEKDLELAYKADFATSKYNGEIYLYEALDFSENNWYKFALSNIDYNNKIINFGNTKPLSAIDKNFVYNANIQVAGFDKPLILSYSKKENFKNTYLFLLNSFFFKDKLYVNAVPMTYFEIFCCNKEKDYDYLKINYDNNKSNNYVLGNYGKGFSYDNCANIHFPKKELILEQIQLSKTGG